MEEYRLRLIDRELDELSADLAAISLDGPKGVGKTVTASRRAATIYRLDDVASAELLRAAPEQLHSGRKPILLDEWQRVPEVWDLVRRAVDRDQTGGQFLLTGSATPASAAIHSGAGRIVSLRMRPLSIAERSIESPSMHLSEMFEGSCEIRGRTDVALRQYVEEIVSSGFPAIRQLRPRARRLQLDSYIARVVDRDFPEQGARVRRPETLRAWMAAYAAATASTASYATIARAATPGGADKPAKETLLNYRDVLSQLWLLDSTPAWTPSHNHFTRLGTAPKHFLADPALAARLLGLDEEKLLSGSSIGMLGPQDGTVLGALFEALVALSLHTYAQSNEATVSHFRSHSGDREVDFIVHKSDRTTVAFEVKLDRKVDDSDVKHLLWLKAHLGEELRDMAVLYTGDIAYRRSDGVAVIPAALLTA